MWWLVTLLVLALISFFVVKTMKESTKRKQAEHESLQSDRLNASSTGLPPAQSPEGSAGAVAAATVATQAAASEGNSSDTSATAAASSHSGSTSLSGAGSAASLNTGDTLSDVREMIKILNLDGPDAGRLGISREALTALRKGDSSGIPDASALDDVAARLRRMIA